MDIRVVDRKELLQKLSTLENNIASLTRELDKLSLLSSQEIRSKEELEAQIKALGLPQTDNLDDILRGLTTDAEALQARVLEQSCLLEKLLDEFNKIWYW